MPIQPSTLKIGSTQFEGRKKYARAAYSFAADGGATGDITLTTTPVIPSGALVTEAIIKVNTALTGATATVALKLEAAADLNAADAISGAPWSTTGVKRADKLGVADAGIVTTAARSVVATVGTAALTAGAFDVIVEYMELA